MIERLFVDETVADSPLVQEFAARLKDVSPVIVEGPLVVQQMIQKEKDPISAGKKTLFLTKNRGAFVKKCPGTRSYLCCGYQILHVGTYCTMDCAYCILQTYFSPPVLQYFVNIQDLYQELDVLFHHPTPPRFHRIGTGEFTDSLIWEKWSDGPADLVRLFGQQDRIVLELKTKTVNISGLRFLPHNRKTIMAWSLNPPTVVSGEERKTASLEARLKAAAQCQSWGYPLAFHFDPLILFDGCERQYEETVKKLFQAVSPENIVWISMGSFRYLPLLKDTISKRFPRSKIAYGEFVRGLDGKMRYFKPLRIALYKKIVAWIREYAPHVTIYFCMEDEKVWKNCLGFSPEKESDISQMLDQAAAKHCGIILQDT